MRIWQTITAHGETIAIFAATIGVLIAMFLPGLALGFIVIFGIVRYLNHVHDPRHQKRPPDAP